MDNEAEDLLFEVDQLISDNKIVEAKNLLIEVLENYPDYGKAHNHLGWIYHYKMIDYEKAERHYKLALRYAPKYHAPYANYSYLLIDKGQNDEMLKFGQQSYNKENVDKGTIANQMAKAYELKGELKPAYTYYTLAKQQGMANGFVEEVNASLHRVRDKMNIVQKLMTIFK